MLDFRKLHEKARRDGTEAVAELLKSLGYPWYNQKAAFFAQDIRIDIATADYELIQTIRGVGPKLASLWMRIVHNEDLPIIDTHVKKWIRANGYKGTDSYKAMAIFFQKEAGRRGVSVEELDRSIVTEGIKRRRGLE